MVAVHSAFREAVIQTRLTGARHFVLKPCSKMEISDQEYFCADEEEALAIFAGYLIEVIVFPEDGSIVMYHPDEPTFITP